MRLSKKTSKVNAYKKRVSECPLPRKGLERSAQPGTVPFSPGLEA